MKQVIREPLLHFLLLGALIFVAYGLMNKRASGDTKKIVITKGQIEHLVDTFTRANQGPPTDQERQGVINDYIRGEVYYREALALGLDRNDEPIRQRLRTKMEFISEDVAAQVEPTADQLRAYLKAHADKFRVEQHFTFRQVYLNPDRHSNHVPRDAQQLLATLQRAGENANLPELGDPFLLDPQCDNLSTSDIAKEFGQKFAAILQTLPVGKWQGPIESGFGVHLVIIRERSEGRIPQLDEVRAAVRREWANDYRLHANERFYQSLLKHYTITFEDKALNSDEKTSAQAGQP